MIVVSAGRTKKDVVTEFRCAGILQAARSVFASKGYEAATVDEIAEFAGIAKGTIYCYFPSKFELFIGTLRKGMLELQELSSNSMRAAHGAPAKIRAFIQTRLEYGDQNREFYHIYFTEFSKLALHPSAVRQEFQDLYHEQSHLLEAVIRAGIRDGEIRRVPALRAAYFIYEATRSAVAQRIQGWDTAALEESGEMLFDLIWKGVECR
jgi:AcrR family transcriptional regulator